MRIIIVSKSAYCTKTELCGSCIETPIVMAGHTIQLVRPLVAKLKEIQSQIALVFPMGNVDDEAIIYDPLDKVPEGIILTPYLSRPIPKSIHHSGYLELNAALIEAGGKLGHVDWVLFVNSFPALLFAKPALHQLKIESTGKMKVGALLRGGDGYKWTQLEFLSNWFQNSEIARHIQKMYIASLQEADFVVTASKWLKQIVEAVHVNVSNVIPSPPVPLSSQRSDANKQHIATNATPFLGKVDPKNKWIMVVGRFHPDKNLELAISAFSASPLHSCQLIFAGAGDVDYLNYIVQRAPQKTHGRIAGITIPPRMLTKLYSAMDIILHTAVTTASFTDARPSALTSAAFHRKPVVAVLGGGIAECLSKTNNDLLCVDPTKCETREDLNHELAQRLELVLDPSIRSLVGDANAEHSRRNSVQKRLDSLVEILATEQ